MKHVFLCFVLLFLGSTTAVWGETLSELQQRAESGDSDAQYDLAMRYWEGKEGAPKDDSKAFYWTKKAAEQGNAYAQSWVGYFYENAYGTARDFGEAAYWYRRSADQGNRFSQNNLGECYYYGRGVERSYEKAVLWYKKAADQEFPSACYNLGWCYENGEGVASNRSLAISYYRKAAASGNEDARQRLSKLGLSADGSSTTSASTASTSSSSSGSHVDPSTLANAQSGIDVSQYVLGQQYFDDGNYEQAVYWWRQAAKQGYGKASLQLGECYYNSLGVDRNYKTAAYWYTEAAEQGENDACFKLGVCYEEGIGVIRDYQIAFKYYEKGNFMLAAAHCCRKWLQQQNRTDLNYLTLSIAELLLMSSKGDALAQCYMGLSAYIDSDLSKAKAWFQKCVDNANATSLSRTIARKYIASIEEGEEETDALMEFFGF